jgi:CDP-glycerol glycerophosphotransferase (TagB/SpsB family)
LTNMGRPVVLHRSLNGLWHYIRSGIVVFTGTSYPNLFKFVGKSTIKICLYHGMGPRSTNSVYGTTTSSPIDVLKKYHKFDYFNFTSKYTNTVVGRLQFLLPENKRVILGLPRCDHLLDKDKVEESRINKNQLRKLNYFFDKGTKCILYSPTWRANINSISFPLSEINDFNVYTFDQWLKENNILFLISVHPHMENLEDFSDCTNIQYISYNPLVDINQLLPEMDLLITDYSSIATDYMLMDRPVIYVMPDYDDYLYNFGLLEDMRSNLPGLESKNMSDLKNYIVRSLKDPHKMQSERKKYLKKYYDIDNSNSCEKISIFIESLIS